MSRGNWIQLLIFAAMIVALAVGYIATSNSNAREIQHIIDLQEREAVDIKRIHSRLDAIDVIVREHDIAISSHDTAIESIKQEVYR